MSKTNYICYYAVTQYGNEYGYWSSSNRLDTCEDVENIAVDINKGRYDGKASITIISWQVLS